MPDHVHIKPVDLLIDPVLKMLEKMRWLIALMRKSSGRPGVSGSSVFKKEKEWDADLSDEPDPAGGQRSGASGSSGFKKEKEWALICLMNLIGLVGKGQAHQVRQVSKRRKNGR
jgi:hypothetical protein